MKRWTSKLKRQHHLCCHADTVPTENSHIFFEICFFGEAVFEMSKNLENPLTINKISRVVNLSLRQTERLFSKHLRMTPKKYYLKLRLLHGRQLIEQTSMSILEISIASGFSSRRVFSKYYFNEFGFLPSHTRRTP